MLGIDGSLHTQIWPGPTIHDSSPFMIYSLNFSFLWSQRSVSVFLLIHFSLASVERSIDENSRSSMQKDTFDGSRKDFNVAIDRICEFTGEHCCA